MPSRRSYQAFTCESPELAYTHDGSALAAVDGLLEMIDSTDGDIA
ncbi:hypothetical protein VMT65_11820 [Nocardia sp. CDC153]|nr:hypothetical protein [Nocardia sp. CDC153]MEC3953723.1 hypothetical protein [Nocardia sp. CDC153]